MRGYPCPTAPKCLWVGAPSLPMQRVRGGGAVIEPGPVTSFQDLSSHSPSGDQNCRAVYCPHLHLRLPPNNPLTSLASAHFAENGCRICVPRAVAWAECLGHDRATPEHERANTQSTTPYRARAAHARCGCSRSIAHTHTLRLHADRVGACMTLYSSAPVLNNTPQPPAPLLLPYPFAKSPGSGRGIGVALSSCSRGRTHFHPRPAVRPAIGARPMAAVARHTAAAGRRVSVARTRPSAAWRDATAHAAAPDV